MRWCVTGRRCGSRAGRCLISTGATGRRRTLPLFGRDFQRATSRQESAASRGSRASGSFARNGGAPMTCRPGRGPRWATAPCMSGCGPQRSPSLRGDTRRLGSDSVQHSELCAVVPGPMCHSGCQGTVATAQMHRKRGQSPCTSTETHRVCLAFAVPHCTFSAVRPNLQKGPRCYPHISSSSRSTVGSAGADDKTCEGLGAQGFCTQGRTAQGYAGRPKWRGRRDTASGGGIAPPPSPCAPCAHAGRTRVGSTTPPCPREAPGAPASRVASAPEPRTLSEWRAVWREASGHRHHKLDSGVGRYRDVGAGRRDHARGSLRREADREHLSVRIHDPLPPRVMRTERLRWPRPEPAVPRPSRTPPPPQSHRAHAPQRA